MELSDIRFPPGSKAISADMNPIDLLRSLKRCCKFFSQLEQDQDEEKKIYLPFCRYIAESDFIQDIADSNTKIHIGCILADIFRLYAPENPFHSEKVKDIFLFLNEQLSQLKDVKSALYSKAYHILENISTVKSYTICMDLDTESADEVYCGLFKTFFSIVNSGHDTQLKSHMLDVMSFIITDSGVVTQKLLDNVLECLLEKTRKMNPSAYELARDLLRKTAQVVEGVLMVFFQSVLLSDHKESGRIAQNWPQLIFELYRISPTLLVNTIPQLELKLRTDDAQQRLQVVRLLVRMFSDKESDLSSKHGTLWSCFLCRFNDVEPQIRKICVAFCSDMIINHGADGSKGQIMTKELISCLRQRRHDTEDEVRIAVVLTIREIAVRDLQLASDEILEFIKERLLDRKAKVRDTAVRAVADIYKKYSASTESPRFYKRKLGIFKNQLLHVYYTQNLKDCILLERILVSSLVPYSLPDQDRMSRLLELYCTVDNHAARAVVQMIKSQKIFCDCLTDILDAFTQEEEEEKKKRIWPKIIMLSNQLESPSHAREHVKKFISIAQKDPRILQLLRYLLSEEYTCQKVAIAVRDILKKVDADGLPKVARQTVQQLLERVVLLRVLIDPTTMVTLMKLVCDLLDGITDLENFGEEAKTRAIDLLQVLALALPCLFARSKSLEHLLVVLRNDDKIIAEKALNILRHTAPMIEKEFSSIRTILIPDLKTLAKSGTPKQAKYSVSCMNLFTSVREAPLMQVFHYCKDKASEDELPSNIITMLTTLGCVAQCLPESAGKEMKSFIASVVVKKIIMRTKEKLSRKKKDSKWCDKDLVSKETSTKIAAMKCMVRWLCGLNSNDLDCCGSTLRLLQHMMHNNGDLMKCGQILKADMAHLRLEAAVCVLKIACCSEYRELISSSVYQELAILLTDEVVEVRRHFLKKLQQALFGFQVHISFMSLFSMVSQEKLKEDREHGTKLYHQLVARYREFNKLNSMNAKYTHCIMPEYAMSFTIHMLANDPDISEGAPSKPTLSRIKEAVNFMLDPLLTRDHPESFGFIKRLAEMIKRTKCQVSPEDEALNEALYAVCDLVLQSVLYKSGQYAIGIVEPPDDALKKFLPSRLYTKLEKAENLQNYLPKEFHIVPKLVPTLSSYAPAPERGRRKVLRPAATNRSPGPIAGKLVAVSKVAVVSTKNAASPPQKIYDSIPSSPEPSIESFTSSAPSNCSPVKRLKRGPEKRLESDDSDDENLAVTRKKLMAAKRQKIQKREVFKKKKVAAQSENNATGEESSVSVESEASVPSSQSSLPSITASPSRSKRASAGRKMFEYLQSTKRSPAKHRSPVKKSATQRRPVAATESPTTETGAIEVVVIRRSGRQRKAK